jgi:hypothetical protein
MVASIPRSLHAEIMWHGAEPRGVPSGALIAARGFEVVLEGALLSGHGLLDGSQLALLGHPQHSIDFLNGNV